MIGVIADSSEHPVVSEFFELFKTPWEFYRSDRRYEVLLCAGDGSFDENVAKLIVIYAGQKLAFDAQEKIEIASRRSNSVLSYNGAQIPIYGGNITFREKGTGVLVEEESWREAMHRPLFRGGVVVRIGYDLFAEVGTLLTAGQPAAYAGIPTLDLHIALLRDLIVASGIPLVEIPPFPDGYRSIACLTHDVDHPSIRQHKWDHTMFGFLYRAVFGSLGNFFRGRMPVRRSAHELGSCFEATLCLHGFCERLLARFRGSLSGIGKGALLNVLRDSLQELPRTEASWPGFQVSRYSLWRKGY